MKSSRPYFLSPLPVIVFTAWLSFSPAAHAQEQTLDQLVKQAIAARDAKNHAQAVFYFEQVLAFMEKGLGRDHGDLVQVLDALGAAHRELKQYPQALAYFQRSLQIDEKTLGPDHPAVAADLRALADI